MTKRSRSQAKLPCVSKVKPYLRVQSTAVLHNLVHNASSIPSLLLCQWKAGKVNWEDSKTRELKISAGVPSGNLKTAMMWRQTIVLRISKSGNALDRMVILLVLSITTSMMFWTENKTNREIQPAQLPKRKQSYSSTLFSGKKLNCYKQLKTCINKFYGCIDLRVIFQSARRIKSFFPYKDIINRSQMSKVVYKAIWDC